jgi:hypothetical protein
MIIRKAILGDIGGVLMLQSKYLYANIPENERAGGFVTTPFTIDQLTKAIEIDGVFVAQQEEQIVGYAFVGTWEYFFEWPIFPFMAARLPQLDFEGNELTIQNTFQYGPICIDTSQRGTGLAKKLYDTARFSMADRFPIGITFINKINHRSYEAHTQKMGLTVIDEFSFNNNNYYGLAFYTN